MPIVGKVARVLGPKGLMPNPQVIASVLFFLECVSSFVFLSSRLCWKLKKLHITFIQMGTVTVKIGEAVKAAKLGQVDPTCDLTRTYQSEDLFTRHVTWSMLCECCMYSSSSSARRMAWYSWAAARSTRVCKYDHEPCD